MSPINIYFDRIIVINLEKRKDRKMMISQKLNRLGINFEFITGVDGSCEKYGQKNSEQLERLNKGEWGYLKTYEKILSYAKSKGFKRILCLDDDVLFHNNFISEFVKFSSYISEDWKLIYLGASQHSWILEKTYNQSTDDNNSAKPYYYPIETDGSFAIGIDSSIYDLLLSEIQKFDLPFDSGPLYKINKLYPKKCFVARPNLVIAEVSESDIREGDNQYDIAEKVKWNMDLYDFPFKGDLVSVIMPAYNAEKTIEKSIRSLLKQTYKHLEIIVADDGSLDNTANIVKKLQREDGRIKLIENELNRGCYYVRNDALRLSRGRIIAIQDADDISLPDRLEKQILPIVTGNAKFTISKIYRSRCEVEELNINSPQNMIELVESKRVKDKHGNFDYRDQRILGFNSSVFDRTVFENIGLFWEHRFAADAEFAERILMYYADIRLKENENIHSFLTECDSIKGLYQRIDDVLVISVDMKDTNISNVHQHPEKKEFEIKWRERFDEKINYNYPQFKKHERLAQLADIPNSLIESEEHGLMQQKIETNLSAKGQMLEASRKQIKKLEGDLAWYSRTYDHLPKWFLKIGSLFRRWPFS